MIDEIAPVVPAQATERPIGEQEGAEYPGSINVGGGFFEGHYPGNRLVAFSGAEPPIENQVNDFFKERPGAVVTGMWFNGGTVYVLFTRLISREEADGLQKFSAEVKAKINAEKAKKAELEAETNKRAAEASAKLAEETKRYAELGRRCEQNHGKKVKSE